jgi:hypothetical protein
MIEVRMRHQHEVDLRKLAGGQRALHQSKRSDRAETHVDADATEQRRVRQDSYAVEVDEDRCVSQPGQRDRIVGPPVRLRLVRRPGNVATDLVPSSADEPCAPGRGRAQPRAAANACRESCSHERAAAEQSSFQCHVYQVSVIQTLIKRGGFRRRISAAAMPSADSGGPRCAAPLLSLLSSPPR